MPSHRVERGVGQTASERVRHMPISAFVTLVVCALVGTVVGQGDRPGRPGGAPPVPLADHHQHVFSAELAELMSRTTPVVKAPVRTARHLVTALDAAGIGRAVVLSAAYIYEQPSRKVEGAAARVRRENDWTSREVAQYPDRLVGFCGLNPLKDYALDELARCAADPHLRAGLKLHFGNSVVDYHNPAHIEQVQRVLRAANGYGMAIVAHLRASVTEHLPYGRAEALIFLDDLLSAAPDVVVQVAHLAGAGSWEDDGAQQAFAVLAEAVANRDPRTRRLYFDVTAVDAPATPETAQRWAAMMRRAGMDRIVFGSDATLRDFTPGRAWLALRALLPLTDGEFRTIAGNELPYLR